MKDDQTTGDTTEDGNQDDSRAAEERAAPRKEHGDALREGLGTRHGPPPEPDSSPRTNPRSGSG